MRNTTTRIVAGEGTDSPPLSIRYSNGILSLELDQNRVFEMLVHRHEAVAPIQKKLNELVEMYLQQAAKKEGRHNEKIKEVIQ